MTEDQIAELEVAMSPKQKKVVNFLLGQVMKVNKTVDTKKTRHLIIQKLSEATYELEHA